MLALINYLKCRFTSRKGQGIVEYGLIIGLIAVIIVAAFALFREPLINFFGEIGEFFTNQSGEINPGS
jgi:pilus assembly protein Flp/PilA